MTREVSWIQKAITAKHLKDMKIHKDYATTNHGVWVHPQARSRWNLFIVPCLAWILILTHANLTIDNTLLLPKSRVFLVSSILAMAWSTEEGQRKHQMGNDSPACQYPTRYPEVQRVCL
jgi:hypothetical protein